MKSLHSWLVRVCKLLQKYELPTAYDVLNNPQKHCWETLITRAITKYLEKELKEEAATKSSLSYLNLENYILNEIHSTWKIQASVTLTIVKASIHARLLMQQCQFFSNCTASKAYGHPCQLCCPDGAPETMSHFLLRGLALEKDRQIYWQEISNTIHKHSIRGPQSKNQIVRLILEHSGHMSATEDLFGISRNMC